jgi:hypothetical protein
MRAEEDRLIVEKVEAIEQRMLARFAVIPRGVSMVDELLAERREAAVREADDLYRPTARGSQPRKRVAEEG